MRDPHLYGSDSRIYCCLIELGVDLSHELGFHQESNVLLPDLGPVQRTFRPWRRGKDISSSRYMFNKRAYFRDPCNRPAGYFLNSVTPFKSGVYTDYLKHNSGVCSKPDIIQNLKSIRVFSHKLYLDPEQVKGPRRECCSVVSVSSNILVVGIKHCGSDDLLSMQI